MNACDAMSGLPVEERRLLVRSGTREGEVWIGVTDAGPGIDAEALPRLFDPFFTTKARGMGLGLTVCRTIIEAHGGQIHAENNADRGATFFVTLPENAGGQAE
jgi:C4-dicarboxylate-specific signal transduction histidine kinase